MGLESTALENYMKKLYMDEIQFLHPVPSSGAFGEVAPCNLGEIDKKGCSKTNVTITNVKIVVPNKVVEVTFSDGTKEKAVCHEEDIFSLETAIGVCFAKKAIGGSSKYNNAIRKGLKVYENKLKQEELEEQERERLEKKRIKHEVKRRMKTEEKQKKMKEEAIEIQKEAYIRAMKELHEK